MIFFNDVALETVAPVRIEDVHVTPIQLSPVSRQRPIRFGSDFVRMQGGNRSVTITFALLTNDIGIRQDQLRAIARWARSDKPGKLVLPYHDSLDLECICTGLPSPSLRQWWESQLSITFETMDTPYWNSITERAVACGTQISTLGDAPPLMRIERTLSAEASNQSYTDDENTMTFSTIPEGDLVIDLNRQLATVNGESIMQYYTYGSAFIHPRVGIYTITGTGNVLWRERWE